MQNGFLIRGSHSSCQMCFEKAIMAVLSMSHSLSVLGLLGFPPTPATHTTTLILHHPHAIR